MMMMMMNNDRNVVRISPCLWDLYRADLTSPSWCGWWWMCIIGKGSWSSRTESYMKVAWLPWHGTQTSSV